MMSEICYSIPTEQRERTSWQPLFRAQKNTSLLGEEEHAQNECIPVAFMPGDALQETLAEHFPRSTPFSVLLLYISSFEHIQMPPDSPIVHKRLRCRVSASLLEQVMHTVRRALRADDQVLLDDQGAGAVFLFPQVDQEGISHIAERVSYNIHLLQAETVIPPLQYETEIVLGAGSYPQPATSLDALFACASQIRERITFRPAVLPKSDHAHPRPVSSLKKARHTRIKKVRSTEGRVSAFPFMQIPSRLPARLKQLVPYPLALNLRCAPVGRDHNRLTVAMANPADPQAIGQLRAATGMAIFPVACEISALEILLASGW